MSPSGQVVLTALAALPGSVQPKWKMEGVGGDQGTGGKGPGVCHRREAGKDGERRVDLPHTVTN